MVFQNLANILDELVRWAPWSWLALFLAASALMIWRLGALERRGFEGTVLGTLIMPYCSGLPNILFALVMAKTGSRAAGALVLENCLVNNVTNATLLIGLPALFWSLDVLPAGKKGRRRGAAPQARRLGRLSLLLTLVAMAFFSGVLWALARDGRIDFADALVLVGVFLFWQAYHVIDVLKENVRRNRALPLVVGVEFAVILACGYGVYVSIDELVAWIPRGGSGLLVFDNLGWLSGLLMVLPNALLALYYAAVGRPDVVYASQIGDGHICIPLCVGLFALQRPIAAIPYLQTGVALLLGAGLVHFLFVSLLGRLPRWMGAVLVGAYGVFIYIGLIS